MSELKKIKTQISSEEIDPLERLKESNELLSNETNQIAIDEARRNQQAKYSCSLLKFACFVEARNCDQRSIVRNRIKKSEGGNSWYHYARNFIKKSIENNSTTSIYKGISHLSNLEPNPLVKFDDRKIKYCHELLDNYNQISFPLELQELRKVTFKPMPNSFKYGNIEIKMTQDLHFFRARYKGENIIGALQLNYVKTPMTTIQMKVATHLLSTFIEDNLLKEGEKCMPEFCICIDLKSKKYVSAPVRSDIGKVRIALSKAVNEFDLQWKSVSAA